MLKQSSVRKMEFEKEQADLIFKVRHASGANLSTYAFLPQIIQGPILLLCQVFISSDPFWPGPTQPRLYPLEVRRVIVHQPEKIIQREPRHSLERSVSATKAIEARNREAHRLSAPDL